MTPCRCHVEFHARQFRSIAEADKFVAGARNSGIFLAINAGKTRFDCRECGESWEILIRPRRDPEWRQVPPWPPSPFLATVLPERIQESKEGELHVLYPREASREVARILDAIRPCTSPFEEQIRNGDLEEVRVIIGTPLRPDTHLEAVYATRWPSEALDRAWWGLRTGHHDRVVEIQVIRRRSRRARFGFVGGLHLLVVDTRADTVRASHGEILGE